MCRCSSLAKKTSFRNDGRVFGTWDFKWPRGAVIDVRFQALPSHQMEALDYVGVAPSSFQLTKAEAELVAKADADLGVAPAARQFGRLTRVVECLAQRWLHGSNNQADIELVFHHDRLLPEPRALDSRSGKDKAAPADYDVLVSLADLPQTRTLDQTGDGPKIAPAKMFLPGSELGRYAQRADYGVPTTYLGKRESFPGSASDYFASQEFWHWCVHEFGHVLGLPHEHQNPNVHARILAELREETEVRDILAKALGRPDEPNADITLGEIQEEISTAWPAVRNGSSLLYSDFRQYAEGLVPDDSSSIMFHIYWKRLLKTGSDNAPPTYLERPTKSDLDHLRAMYPLTP